MNNSIWKRRFTALLLAAVFTTGAQAQTPFIAQNAATESQIQNSIPAFIPGQIDAKTAQIWPNGISYEPADYFQQPYIQPDLRVGYKFNYKFTFNLKARDFYGKTLNVPDGWYLFTAAILLKDTSMIYNRPQPADVYDRYVTSSAPLAVLVTGGEITTPVVFRFDNLTATALSNLLFVELLPLKDTCDYPSKTKRKNTIPCIALKQNGEADMSKSDVSQLRPSFRPYLAQTSFIPFRAKDSVKPVINADSSPFGVQTLASFVLEARRRQERMRAANSQPTPMPKAYAAMNGMTYLDVRDPELKSIGQTWLKNEDITSIIQSLLDERALGAMTLNESYRRIMPAICEYLYRHNSAYANAGTPPVPSMMPSFNPKNIFRICGQRDAPNITLARVIHVGKVDTTSAPKISLNPQLNYNILNNFIISRGRSRDFSRSFTGKTSALLNPVFKLVESTGFAIPFDFTYSVSESHNQSKSEAQMASMGESMDFNPLGLVFTAAQAQVCLQVSVAPLRGSLFYDPAPNAKNGLYICGAPRRQMEVEEIYAHIFTSPRDSSINRAFEAVSQTLNVSLRGDRDLSAFFIGMRSNLKPVHGPEIFPSQAPAAVQNAFAAPMVTPNIVSNPIGFEKGYQPSLVQMALWQYRETFMEDQASR